MIATMQIREKATEVLVAGAVPDEKGNLEMCSLMKLWNGKFYGGSDESTESVLFGGEVGPGRSIDSHVINESDGLVAEFSGPLDEILRLAGTPQEGEGGAGVEFGKQV